MRSIFLTEDHCTASCRLLKNLMTHGGYLYSMKRSLNLAISGVAHLRIEYIYVYCEIQERYDNTVTAVIELITTTNSTLGSFRVDSSL